MNTALFIRRPIMTTLVMAGILFFGIMGYRLLPVSDLPNVDFPTIQVTASLPGASPETMASAVATPLEKQFSTIAGIDSMTSTSALGLTNITIQFSLDRSIDAAAQDVQAAIGKAASQLSPGMPTPPTYQKVNPADQPIRLGAGVRLAEVRRARSARPQRLGLARHRHRRGPEGRRPAQREPPYRNALRPLSGVQRAGDRAAHRRRSLSPPDRGVPERLPRAFGAARPGDRQRPDRQGGELVQRRPGRRLGHPAAAGHEHGRGRGLDPKAVAHFSGADSRIREPQRPVRPLDLHPRLSA